MLPRLRRIVSCLFLVFSVLFAALWVRSYFWSFDTIYYNTPTVFPSSAHFESQYGSFIFQKLTDPRTEKSKHDWKWNSDPSLRDHRRLDWTSLIYFAAGYDVNPDNGKSDLTIVFPHWFAMLLLVLLAIAIRPQPRWRYGARDLFTLLTVAAVVVGLLAIGLREIGQ